MTNRFFLALIVCLCPLSCEIKPQTSDVKVISSENKSQNLSSAGPFEVLQSPYSLPASEDPLVFSELKTDLRGQLYAPKRLDEASYPEGFPLVIILHGNHATCGEITETGIRENYGITLSFDGYCPEGLVEAPSHLGYEYIGRHLASLGFVVASINANRGINGVDSFLPTDNSDDPRLIKARGKLVLKHLAFLQSWNDKGAPDQPFPFPIKGLMDFSKVGLIGHSRGGEGVRAASYFYRKKTPQTYADQIRDMTIKGIFEFAPIDQTSDLTFDALGIDWVVVMGSCDGDLTTYQGIGPFKRRRNTETDHFSATLVVPGANHNFFNSEWQYDEGWCVANEDQIQRPTQERIGLYLAKAFMLGFVGESSQSESFQKVFDPQYHLPDELGQLAPFGREAFHQSSKVRKLSLKESSFARVTPSPDYDRDAFILEWDQKAQDKSIFMSLEKPIALAANDLIGLSLAKLVHYKKCFHYVSIPCDSSDKKDFNLEIRLQFEGGTTSKFVATKDSGIFMPTNVYLEKCQAEELEVSPYYPNYCRAKAMNSWQCLEAGYIFYENECLFMGDNYERHLLYVEFPFEATDFGITQSTQVVGLEIRLKDSGFALLDSLLKIR